MCLAGALVVSWSLTQEVAGSSLFNDKYLLSLNSLNWIGAAEGIAPYEGSVIEHAENSLEPLHLV